MNYSLLSIANITSQTIREWCKSFIKSIKKRLSIKGEKYRKVAPEEYEEACSIVTDIKERKNPYKSPLSLITLPSPFEDDAVYASKLLASLKATPMRKTSPISVCSNETIENISNRRHTNMPRLEIAKNLQVDTSFNYYYDSESCSLSSIPPYSHGHSELSRNSSRMCYSKELKNLSQSLNTPSSCNSHWRVDDGEIPRRSSATLSGLKESELLEYDTSIKTDIEEMECTTALVSRCPSEGNLSPSLSPRLNNAKWGEFYTETPASSPIAGLTIKPIRSRVKFSLYKGMFHTSTIATAIGIEDYQD